MSIEEITKAGKIPQLRLQDEDIPQSRREK